MSKELEALDRIKPFKFVNKQEELDYAFIEKSLKKLEIIKEKYVDMYLILRCKNQEEYNEKRRGYYCCKPLTKEEFYFLKEVWL